VRQATPETLIVTNGFSCREQIEHGTQRHALHLAQLLQRVLAQSHGAMTAEPDPAVLDA
jgi:hypothetical protein